MKKFITVVLAAMMVVASLSSCSSPNPVTNSDSSAVDNAVSKAESTNATDTGVEKGLEKYAEPVKMTMFAQINANANYEDGQTFEDNIWSRLYKDALNIELEYKWIVTAAQYNEKLNVAIASKDFADIMSFGVGDKNMNLMNDAGYLQDLGAVYDEYATKYTKSLIESDGGVALNSGKLGGTQIAIPNIGAGIEGANILWIREDWLKKSGKEAPKTMEELYELAKIFKEANYDGVTNVTGLLMDKGSATEAISAVRAVFSGYGSYPNKWVKTADGSLAYGSILPETKEALAYVAKMYKEGLIDKEYGVKDGTIINEDVSSGRIGLAFGGHADPLWRLNATFERFPDAEWQCYPIPSVDGKDATQVVGINVGGYYSITKDAKNPEAMLKLMNLFTKTCFSSEGDPMYYLTNEKYREPFIHAMVQCWPATKNIDVYKGIQEYRKTGDEEILNNSQEVKEMFAFCKSYEDTKDKSKGWDYAKVFDVGGSEQILNSYLENDKIIYHEFYGVATPTMITKKASLDKLEAQVFTQIIMGASPIESYDKFVEDWKKLGGDGMTKEVNDWAKANK